jgi:Fe-S-cluster-containing dehydrogenase component/DMSO reductase anchor subunit
VYRDAIPLTAPAPGEQYAFEVDLDACTGCKACVTACHSLNGLDADETWRGVGFLVGGGVESPALQPVTTTCHHCAEPGCLSGCPVRAYEKDATTGIVRHLDDQCIGCRYCELMCPYEVPRYSAARGIVRKCDMCHGRLAAGEAPACVQGCPNGAIAIRVVRTDDAPGPFVPDAPDPSLTRPTTRFVSRRGLPAGLRAVARDRVTPAAVHGPLVAMLVLTQLGVGAIAAAASGGAALGADGERALAAGGLAALLAGLGASVLHLGRPRQAWRAFLGLGTSWLSREIVAFGVLVPLAAAYVLALWVAPAAPARLLGGLATCVGLVGVLCSACIYGATGRAYWTLARTATRFFGSTVVLGAVAALIAAAAAGRAPATAALVAALAGGTVATLAVECDVLRRGRRLSDGELDRSARLLGGPLRGVLGLRIGAGLVGGLVLPALLLASAASVPPAVGALACCLGGELAARVLFFTAVAPERMPGAR